MVNPIEKILVNFKKSRPVQKLSPMIFAKSWSLFPCVGSSQADQKYAPRGSGGRSQPGELLDMGTIVHACTKKNHPNIPIKKPNNLQHKTDTIIQKIQSKRSLKAIHKIIQVTTILTTVTLTACATIRTEPIHSMTLLQKQSDLLHNLKTERNAIEELKLFKLVPALEKSEIHLQEAIEALIESNRVLMSVEQRKQTGGIEN